MKIDFAPETGSHFTQRETLIHELWNKLVRVGMDDIFNDCAYIVWYIYNLFMVRKTHYNQQFGGRGKK